MRFIHTGDIHLGATPDISAPWGKERGKEIWDTFKSLIEVVKEQQPDVFFISGDLFHRQPQMRELKEVSYLFASIMPTRVIMIAGNHDPITNTSNYKNFRWPDNVFFMTDEKMEILSFDRLNADIYGFSYHDKIITEPVYDDIELLDKNRINILVAHGGDENHIPMNFNRILLNGFDYVACGHIHQPYLHPEAKYAYCGSLEPIDKTEIGERGYIEGEITKDERTITFIPFAQRFYLDCEIDISSTMTNAEVVDMIKKFINENGDNNIYHVTIRGFRDPDIEFDELEIKGLGNISRINDLSEPDYDFETLYRNNKDNMVGMFIERFGDRSTLDEVHKKALYFGTKALLDAMEAKS